MPGLYLASTQNKLKTCGHTLSAETFPTRVIDPVYPRKLLLESDKTILGYTYHDNYSTQTFEDGRFVIFVDGLIYEKSSEVIHKELRKISESVFLDRVEARDIVTDWILNTDGEFNLVLLDKETDDILLFNDRLGRLPIYYSQTDGLLLVSRNPWDILVVTGSREFDREAISEYLLFGFVLGKRTLLKNIFHFEAASCLRAGPGSDEAAIENLFSYNFDEKISGTEKISTHADNIVELLYTACRNRVDDDFNTVVSLSAGLDSRTLAICLNNLNIDFAAATFVDYYELFRPEVEFARQIARTLGIDQIVFHLSRASGRDVLDILGIKCGTNSLGVCFVVSLFDKIKAAYGKKITMVMGDGGDRILRDTTPGRRISSLDELTEYTHKNNSMLSPGVVASITGMDERELVSRLRNRLASFEEKEMVSRYLHFIFYDRCRKWHFTGEDRNRAFARHVAPFYASPLFEYSMSLPDRFKKNFRLYREVLTRLSRTVADIPNSEWNFPITSKKLGIYSLARSLYFHLPERLKSIVQRRHHYTKKITVYPADSSTRKCLDSQLKNCPAIGEYLSVDGIRKNLEGMDKMGFDHLFTLVSLMEMVQSGSSSIEQYLESELM
ncbi:MAG: hypothetical protein JSW58_09975 [Candidatus Latescibacterota bacterium]|nr:MAG: hypothetical protein JSW58_09975 [Candidatus Latescibacterota bacterium]